MRGALVDRLFEVLWVVDHLPDLESDFSVFHRCDDMYALPAPLFFARAYRLAAYDGVMSARVREAADIRQKETGGAEVVPLTPGLMHTHPDIAGLIEYERTD